MKPSIIYSALPAETTKFRQFFAPGPVWELLQNPGELRYAGWSLRTLDRARIVRGEYLEVRNGERKILNLYEDGTFIAKAAADETFLGWGARDGTEFESKPRLNPLAVIEFTYCFVDLYARMVQQLEPRPKCIQLQVRIENAFFGENNDSRLYLLPYGVGTAAWMFDDERHVAPDTAMSREIEVSVDELANVGAVAFSLAEKFYTWFGISVDKIPYTASPGDRRIIDPASFSTKR